jgi:hypothetical protein
VRVRLTYVEAPGADQATPELHQSPTRPCYHCQTRVDRFTKQKNHTRGTIMLREEEDSAHAACTITIRKTLSARVHAKTEHWTARPASHAHAVQCHTS